MNTLAAARRWSPALAILGTEDLRLQPIYVADVAEAVLMALTTPSSHGKVYELGGPRIYRYRALIELLLRETGRSRLLIGA